MVRFWDKVKKTSTCWLWQGSCSTGGYGQFKFMRRNWRVHQLAYELSVGPRNGLSVLHKCDNPICVNPEHLYLGTHKDNMRDRSARGRTSKGEDRWSAKLEERQVLEIRQRVLSGEKQESLAAEFGIKQAAVSKIKLGRRWGHLWD